MGDLSGGQQRRRDVNGEQTQRTTEWHGFREPLGSPHQPVPAILQRPPAGVIVDDVNELDDADEGL